METKTDRAERNNRDGHEWHDWPELNLCHNCALTILEEMRPNVVLSERAN